MVVNIDIGNDTIDTGSMLVMSDPRVGECPGEVLADCL